jgi:hypothetical protein
MVGRMVVYGMPKNYMGGHKMTINIPDEAEWYLIVAALMMIITWLAVNG